MMPAGDNSRLVHQSSLAVLPAETSGSNKRMDEVIKFRVFNIFNTSTDFTVRSYDMGLPALLPVRRKVCCGFLSPLKINCFGPV
jgi:hypothetical protein